jgi:hypothetical protein
LAGQLCLNLQELARLQLVIDRPSKLGCTYPSKHGGNRPFERGYAHLRSVTQKSTALAGGSWLTWEVHPGRSTFHLPSFFASLPHLSVLPIQFQLHHTFKRPFSLDLARICATLPESRIGLSIDGLRVQDIKNFQENLEVLIRV